ncbi:MAG: YdcF family protein [Gammaproteobacteria bacterium]
MLPALAGLVVMLRWRRLGFTLTAVAVLACYLLSTPFVAYRLARQLEHYPPVDVTALAASGAEAIVVLGGGSSAAAPEFRGFDEVSRITLERLRYAARLHRATGLELAVSGGQPGWTSVPEAVLMRTVLEGDFRVPVRFAEFASRNTAENALNSREVLPFDTIVLVTHAMHVRRARQMFEDAGFAVIPAPMGYFSRPPGGPAVWTDWLPDPLAYRASQYVVYETLGLIWYRLGGR